jgi:hypothetical protein
MEECWFLDGALHGSSMRRTSDGQQVTEEFRFGYPLASLSSLVNPDFKARIFPLLSEAFDPRPTDLPEILESLSMPTISIQLGSEEAFAQTDERSYAGLVTVMGEHEPWPECEGEPLAPILQLVTSEFPVRLPPWDRFEALTVFATANRPPMELGHDIVVRTYRSLDGLIRPETPDFTPAGRPRAIGFGRPGPSHPDDNDLPPRVRRLVALDPGVSEMLDKKERLGSRLSGWPGWIQSGSVVGLGRFAFQLDSLDFEDWSSGDCAIHYFFSQPESDEIEWLVEMT